MKQKWLIGISVVFLVVAASAVAVAQDDQGGRRGQRGRRGQGGFGRGGFGQAGLLMDANIRKELELVDDQEAKLRAIGEEIGREMRDAFSGMRDLSPEERNARRDEMRTKFQEMRAKMDGRIKDVLLPNQMDRLKQLNLQSQMQRQGTAGALGNEQIVKELGLPEDQLQKLRDRAQQVERELREKIQKLREEARGDLMEVLTPSQQQKLKEMMGDTFEFRQDGGRFGRNPRGGSPGGDRGNRPGRPRRPTAEE